MDTTSTAKLRIAMLRAEDLERIIARAQLLCAATC